MLKSTWGTLHKRSERTSYEVKHILESDEDPSFVPYRLYDIVIIWDVFMTLVWKQRKSTRYQTSTIVYNWWLFWLVMGQKGWTNSVPKNYRNWSQVGMKRLKTHKELLCMLEIIFINCQNWFKKKMHMLFLIMSRG